MLRKKTWSAPNRWSCCPTVCGSDCCHTAGDHVLHDGGHGFSRLAGCAADADPGLSSNRNSDSGNCRFHSYPGGTTRLPWSSEIAKPLSVHTGGKGSVKLNWTDSMTEAFELLKQELRKDFELAFPNYGEGASKLEVFTDASAVGAGAILVQKQDDDVRPIAYDSTAFTDTQKNYSVGDRELAAMRFAIKSFKPFLYGVPFILHTDHKPLIYLHSMAKIDARLSRTLMELSEFEFEIFHTPGIQNNAADALSRMFVSNESSETQSPFDHKYLIPGLQLCDGQPAVGGGDSMFESLFRVLVNLCKDHEATNINMPTVLIFRS